MVSVFFTDTVNAKARHTSTMTSIILASPCGDRERDYAGVIRVQHAPHRTTNVVHGRFLQVHQLGEDGRLLAESLENNSQYGCGEDVEQQRGQHASLP